MDAVVQALHELDRRYVLIGDVAADSGQVPVLRCPDGAAADAARAAATDVAWLVVELYRTEDAVERAHDPVFWLNTAKVDPRTAARAIDQSDLVIWYEVINPVRVITADGGSATNDYRDLRFAVPDGHRTVAHAVRDGEAPQCLPDDAELVLRSHDLWAFADSRDVCPACADRHG
ncbi:hypothetical protein ACFQY4_28485 [Catellatospora bangladeshensis]|uniref:hypothetical protein n=1 Tax=Catellatospora bangladeshensis TaxID=310355 RepID=UPI001944084B|nr:hypothetical protein [Catellatospora bangladeshensis]